MNHQLIDRLQNYTLDKKILSIDSNDRDISKWPNSSEFEISCPQNYNNVESIRLVNIQTQNKFYNISEYLQNNKLLVEFNNSGVFDTITLEDGFYNEIQLQNSLNTIFQNIDSGFIVKFNEVNRKMYIGHPSSSFKLKFTGIISYNNCIINNYNNIYKQHSKWGLGAILGFNKTIYISNNSNNNYKFQYETSDWINSGSYIIESPKNIDLNENEQIFIEVEKLNKSDEIKPYIIDKINNTNSGIVNSFFAKTPIIICDQNQSINNKECYIEGVSYFQPPLDRISKLKIKLRYHNGMLLDLNNSNVQLTFEINQIRNEMKNYEVRKPFVL
jgi:hypothetical protein